MAKKITINQEENNATNPLLKTANLARNSSNSASGNSSETTIIQNINLLKSRVTLQDGDEIIPKRPNPNKMAYGRLAVNYAKGYETLSTKNDADEIVEFKSINYIEDLINQVFGSIVGGETSTIKNTVTDGVITSDAKLSKEDGNILQINEDGLFTTFKLLYGEDSNGVERPGLLVFETPNGYTQTVNLPLESFLVSGGYYEQYYDKKQTLHKKVVVLIVRDEAGEEDEIIIPIADLVNIYTFDGDGRCIKVTTTPSAQNVNEYFVKVELVRSPRSNNIFESTVDGAYVEDFRPYIESAVTDSENGLKEYIDSQDQHYLELAKQDASDKANKALEEAKAYADELDSQVMHLSGGTFTGEVNYGENSSNNYLNGSTCTFTSGSTAKFDEGSDLILDKRFIINWGDYNLDVTDFDRWDNMMPTSGGTFTGNVIWGPNASEIFQHESSQIFANDSTQVFEGGSTINHENNSVENYLDGSIVNHKDGSTDIYQSGSTLVHQSGSTEEHNDGSVDNYQSGSTVNFNPGSNEIHNSSNTEYNGNSVVDMNGGTEQNFNDHSSTNYNNGTEQNFNSGSSQNFDCDSVQNFNCNSQSNFNDDADQHFYSGTTSQFHQGSELILGNGSDMTHQSGSTETYENGSRVIYETGATTDHNGDVTNFNKDAIVNWNSGSTQTVHTGSTVNFDGGSENFTNGASATFDCNSEMLFKCNAEQTFTENATSNFEGSSSQHFNSGTTQNFHKGSEQIFEDGSNETHQSGSTTTYESGSTLNFEGGNLVMDCDSQMIFQCNAEQIFKDDATSNFEGNSEQNFNNGTSQNFNSGSTQEFFDGSEQIFHNGSEETKESGSTTTYESGSTLVFEEGATTDHNGDTTNYNSGATINYGSGSTQNVGSGSTVNFEHGSNLQFTCEDGSIATIDCSKINHWDTATSDDPNEPDSIKNWVKEWVEEYVDQILGDLVTDLSKEYMPISGGTFTGGVRFADQGIVGAIKGVSFDNNVDIDIHSAHVDFYDGVTKWNYSTVSSIQMDCPVEMLRNTSIADGTITKSLTTNVDTTTTFNGTTTFNNDTTHNRTITFPVKQGSYTTEPDIVCLNGGPTQGITNIDCQGSINVADGGYQQSSDRNLKENLEEVDITLEQIEKLSVIYFNYIGVKNSSVGVIAQEIRDICPPLVREDSNGYLTVDYAKLSLIALKGVKLLSEKVNKIEETVAYLVNKVG